MKATLLILAMTWAALVPAPGYTLAIGSDSQQGSGDTAQTGHLGDAGHPAVPRTRPSDDTYRHASRASLLKTNRPKTSSSSHKTFRPRNGTNLHSSTPGSVFGGIESGSISKQPGSNAFVARPSSGVRPTASPVNSVGHRGSNPAVLGGPVNSHSASTGAINGTRMNRKP